MKNLDLILYDENNDFFFNFIKNSDLVFIFINEKKTIFLFVKV